LIQYIRDKAINTEEDLRGHYVDILQQLKPNRLPENELFTQIIQFCLKARDHMYVEDEKITGDYTIKDAHMAGIVFWQRHVPLAINVAAVRYYAKENQTTFLGYHLHNIFLDDFGAISHDIQPTNFEWLTLHREVITRYVLACEGRDTYISLHDLYSQKAIVCKRIEGLSLKIGREEKSAMNVSRPAKFIHNLKGEFKKFASAPLPDHIFMKPVNRNFFAIDYIQRWDAEDDEENIVKVVLLVQNKLTSDPSQIEGAIGKMSQAIKDLLVQNSAVIFIPVFFTLVQNVMGNITTSLTEHFGNYGYVFLTEEATLSFFYPLENRLLFLPRIQPSTSL
jgi:hypothetical protein